jgi:hypothetical protein
MPQALPELIASVRRALDESIRPELSSDFARVQLAGMQDILAKLERMVVWSPDLLRQRLSAMQSGVERMVALASAHGHARAINLACAAPAHPTQAQPEQAQPEQAQPEQAQPEQAQPEQAHLEQAHLEQAARAAERRLALLTDWLFDPASDLPVALHQELDAILRATLREEVLAERRMVPRGDFLAMTAAD